MAIDSTTGQVWAAGDAYEPYVGRWSRRVASEFVHWLEVPRGLRWLDVGCGTGALSQTVIKEAAPAGVTAIDRSQGYLDYASRQMRGGPVSFEVGDGQNLRFAEHEFDAAVSGLVLNFVAEPARMLAEMRRVVRPSGPVGIYVWDYAGEMQLMRYFWDAAAALSPAAHALDEGVRFPMCNQESLAELARMAGWQEVLTRAIDVPTVFRDFDDYWAPFLGGQAPAPSYAMSLDEDVRTALREHIRAKLPIERDGTIRLKARAWAVKGIK